MAAASLYSVETKIIWAGKHFQRLEAEAQRYFQNNPGEVVMEQDLQTNRPVPSFRSKTPIPPEISLIVGDIVQNLRSSLDYLVRELVLAANNQPTDKEMFPICDSPKGFKDAVRRGQLAGVPGDAEAIIKSLQPYRDGQAGKANKLAILNELSNINKHRRVLLTELRPYNIPGTPMMRGGATFLNPAMFADFDAQVAVTTGEKVDVKADLVAFITFDEGFVRGLEVSTTLGELLRYVRLDVISQFVRFFKKRSLTAGTHQR